jgi:hypothetical protein
MGQLQNNEYHKEDAAETKIAITKITPSLHLTLSKSWTSIRPVTITVAPLAFIPRLTIPPTTTKFNSQAM